MKWNQAEIQELSPILEQVQADLEPLEGKHILVLCSASGDVALWLAKKVKYGRVLGLELDPESLSVARDAAKAERFESIVEFQAAEKRRIPLPDEKFDAVVSEFIVFPTSRPTEIGQPEMARVLKAGGIMGLTDVIIRKPYPQEVRDALREIGLDYLCEATQEEFRTWMEEAGLRDVEVVDFTPVVKAVWGQRRAGDDQAENRKGYWYLLGDNEYGLGRGLFYIHVRGKKG